MLSIGSDCAYCVILYHDVQCGVVPYIEKIKRDDEIGVKAVCICTCTSHLRKLPYSTARFGKQFHLKWVFYCGANDGELEQSSIHGYNGKIASILNVSLFTAIALSPLSFSPTHVTWSQYYVL